MPEANKNGYREIVAQEIGEQSEGRQIRITGILISQNEANLIIGDKTGEIEVIYDSPSQMERQEIIRVFGEVHNGRIIAEKVISLNLDFDLFIKMQNMTKKLRKEE